MKINTAEPMAEDENVEEAVPGNRLTLDSLTEAFQLFKTAFDFL